MNQKQLKETITTQIEAMRQCLRVVREAIEDVSGDVGKVKTHLRIAADVVGNEMYQLERFTARLDTNARGGLANRQEAKSA